MCESSEKVENFGTLADDMKSGSDIYRTGAKCVPCGLQDTHDVGSGYHIVGVLRTKPGRGDPTLSMSCSDKIMKWCVLGKISQLRQRCSLPKYNNYSFRWCVKVFQTKP